MRCRISRCRLASWTLGFAWSATRSTGLVVTMLCGLFSQAATAAEKADLVPVFEPDAAVRVDVVLEAVGDLRFKEKEKIQTLPTSVAARQTYDEKRVTGNSAGSTVRLYVGAEANLQVDKTPSKITLRGDRNLIVSQPTDAQPQLFSAIGPLSADELDLLQVPFNSGLVDLLLPRKTTAVGESWKHDDSLMSALLNLDAVSQSDVSSTLAAVDEKAARIEFKGSAQGALGGVATEFEIEGRYKFDLAAKRVVWLAVVLKEQRSIGHVEPGITATSRVQMVLSPTTLPAPLTDGALAEFDLEAKPEYLQIEFASSPGRYSLKHERRWHMMTDAREVLSLRMVDRGDLVAQCNVRAVAAADAERRPTLAQFQADIRRSIDKNFRQFARVSESENSLGYTVFRAEAIGDVQDLEIHWLYYLVQDRAGHQVVFAFTCEQPMLERLGELDQEIVNSVRFADDAATAAQPTPAAGLR